MFCWILRASGFGGLYELYRLVDIKDALVISNELGTLG